MATVFPHAISESLPQWPWLADWLAQAETRALAVFLPGSRLAGLVGEPGDMAGDATLDAAEACMAIERACQSYEVFLARQCRPHQRQYGVFYTPLPLAEEVTA